MTSTQSFFSRPLIVFAVAGLLRLTLLIYGRWQDAHSPVKYTDIDYLVFTDAARFIRDGGSPYERATYRYTPLLAWLLYPTTWPGWWFEFGKVLFAVGDLIAGGLIARIVVSSQGMSVPRAMRYASIWLLNPMVANISTRGSSEGLVVVIVVALLWAVLERRYFLAGVLLGVGVHVKIYPFIYAASIFWWLTRSHKGSLHRLDSSDTPTLMQALRSALNQELIQVIIGGFLTSLIVNSAMFYLYGSEFLQHTYFYHFTRIDHRHNFSIYNTALHLSSAWGNDNRFAVERIAFLPQLFLSLVAIPVILAPKDLASTMLAQTFAFVTFNKVCTSQYFLWYMVFLPFYLPNSSFLRRSRLGMTALVLWVLGQAAWLQQGYQLEFLGRSTFFPGLWVTSVVFFAINCWILGIIISDVRYGAEGLPAKVVDVKKDE